MMFGRGARLQHPLAALWLLLSVWLAAPAVAARLANPLVGSTLYSNPDYVAQVEESMASASAELVPAMRRVSQQSTAVWLDGIAAIDGHGGRRMTLEQHLLEALGQASHDKSVTLMLVVYNLPDRDCAASASNGMLRVVQGLERYRHDYIDRIAAAIADPRFSTLRIVAIIEPDSLPNLVTNQSVAACAAALESGVYVDGIAYALQRFAEIDNVSSYLDIGHSGWLGWDINRARTVELYKQVVLKSGSLEHAQGVVTNVSGYSPVEEPWLNDPDYSIEGQPARAARFYEYNPLFDERDYAIALHTEFRALGFPEHFGVLIDTSRNGWGGADRPVKATWRADVDAFVDEARIDRRAARGHWCNQAGAGIGEQPQPSPYGGSVVHGFVWVKPPGESDGTSDNAQTTPDEQGKRFDASCDASVSAGTGSLAGAPAAGAWFAAHFETLVRNAWPPLLP